MKTNYTTEEWTALGLLEDVPVHRTEQAVHALNYGLEWIERNSLEESNGVTILLIIVLTISTIVDVDDSELEKILNNARTEFDDFYITSTYYGLYEESEFQQKFCEKVIKQHVHKLQLN
jgi:hypothetical protein